MLTTENYKFKKPELTDSPPDITIFNDNFDTIDEKLFAVIQAWEDFKANGGEIGGEITTKAIINKSKSNISYKWEMLDNGFYALNRYINGVFSENVMRFDTANTNINGHLIPFNSDRCIGLNGASWKDIFIGLYQKGTTGHTPLTNNNTLQWGQWEIVATSNGVTNYTITYPKNFNTDVIVIPVMFAQVNGGAWNPVECNYMLHSYSIFNFQIKLNHSSGTRYVLRWLAIGY